MPSDQKFYAGQVVFDKKRTDPTDDMLVVVDANPGTLETFTGEDYRLIKHNDTNKELNDGQPVDDDEPCVKCTYVTTSKERQPTVQSSPYTFPEFRLETLESPNGNPINGYYPHQWALSEFFAELVETIDGTDMTVESADDLQVLAMQAGVDGEVIIRGLKEGLQTNT